MIRYLAATGMLAVVFALGPVHCLAQSPLDDALKAASAGKDAPAAVVESPDESGIQMPAPPSKAILDDPHTRATYLAAMQGYYGYLADGYAYRSRVFEWQLLSSRVIFVVVLTLVGSGLYFAAAQFRIAMRAAKSNLGASQRSTQDPALSLSTQLEIGAKGVVVNSSVLGVIILALSLAFFYLYLVHVYPIRNVF